LFTLWDQVVIEPSNGKKVEHNGVKIELLGQIGVFPLFFFSFLWYKWRLLSLYSIVIIADGSTLLHLTFNYMFVFNFKRKIKCLAWITTTIISVYLSIYIAKKRLDLKNSWILLVYGINCVFNDFSVGIIFSIVWIMNDAPLVHFLPCRVVF